MSTSPTCAPFRYKDGTTPEGYVCKDCGAKGVRLYREYNTFLEYQHLSCRACARQRFPEYCTPEKDAQRLLHSPEEHSIGGVVAAVPTEDGSTYWGFTSVPQPGVEWWNNLPKTTPSTTS